MFRGRTFAAADARSAGTYRKELAYPVRISTHTKEPVGFTLYIGRVFVGGLGEGRGEAGGGVVVLVSLCVCFVVNSFMSRSYGTVVVRYGCMAYETVQNLWWYKNAL